jgi:hypothetical protein
MHFWRLFANEEAPRKWPHITLPMCAGSNIMQIYIANESRRPAHTPYAEAIMETATRDARGRFQPGSSGNPAGKQPGTLNHATRLRQWLDDPEGDGKAVARALVAQAVKGNVPAIRIVMDRLDPKPRSRPIALELTEAATFAERFDAVFAAMAAGDVTPEEALQVARVLDTFSKVADWEAGGDALADRIRAEADARHEAYVASLRDEFERRETALLARIAAAEAKAAAATSVADATCDAPPQNPSPLEGEGKVRGDAVERSTAETEPPAASPQPSPRRGEGEGGEPPERRDYARPWPDGAEPQEALHPTSISRGWTGKRYRYGQRVPPSVQRDGGAPERRPRRRRPLGGTWMSV